jgi:hypothetical protein
MSLLESVSEKVHVIYDPNDGRIIHAHLTTTFKGGREPTDGEIAASGRRAAERNGVKLQAVSSLNVSRKQWESRTSNKVDLVMKSLV